MLNAILPKPQTPKGQVAATHGPPDCFYSLNKKWIKVKVKSLASSSVELNANIDVHAYIQKV